MLALLYNFTSQLELLTQGQWLTHGAIFALNLALFIFAHPLLKLIDRSVGPSRIRMFQALNITFLILHLIDILLISANSNYQDLFSKLSYSLAVIYVAMLIHTLTSALTKKRFGREKTVDEQSVFVETYSSRLVSLIILVIIWLSIIYALIKIWGADSLLETTGIYGIIAAFLAFTSSIWAPDILSGLIVLNSDTIEDGDVVVLDGEDKEYVISRITLIYIVLYDIRHNNRTIIRNSKFMDHRIDNISRVASSSGIRQAIKYNIGYPEVSGDKTTRLAKLASFKDSIDDLFTQTYENCKNNEDIMINASKPFEWALTNTGDYALEYTLWVYLKRVPSTKITSRLRKHLMGSLFKINETVYEAAVAENIDLSTPELRMQVGPPPVKAVILNNKSS